MKPPAAVRLASGRSSVFAVKSSTWVGFSVVGIVGLPVVDLTGLAVVDSTGLAVTGLGVMDLTGLAVAGLTVMVDPTGLVVVGGMMAGVELFGLVITTTTATTTAIKTSSSNVIAIDHLFRWIRSAMTTEPSFSTTT